MQQPTSATMELDQGSPALQSSRDPERAAEIRRQLRGLALAMFSWTARPPDLAASTATERLLAAAMRPLLPKLRDALLSRLDSTDPAALEAIVGATAAALESILYYAPGDPLPRYAWTFEADGSINLAPVDELTGPADGS
jgi:hypothetical protein